MKKEDTPIDEEMLLENNQLQATQSAALMKAALEAGNLRVGLKQASKMLGVLRETELSPKLYYQLCMCQNEVYSHASLQ